MNFAPNPQRLFIRTAHRMDVRPHVVINAAMSVDGKIALSGGKPVRLSNEEDLRRVHALRAKADAVLVGIGTVLKDDPKLTEDGIRLDRKSTRLNSSHRCISYAVFCLKKKRRRVTMQLLPHGTELRSI